MTAFYTRWAIMVGGMILLTIMTFQQYQHDLSTTSLAKLIKSPNISEPVRIQGMVKSGTLSGETEQGQATFELIDGPTTLAVVYAGHMSKHEVPLSVLPFCCQHLSNYAYCIVLCYFTYA